MIKNLDSGNQAITFVICENLKRLRLSHDLSYTKVADILGKTRQAYVNYENGLRHISINDLVTLANFYQISLDEITGNPYQNKSLHELKFSTFVYEDGEITKNNPTIISTILDDIIVLKKNDYQVDFYLKTNVYQKNHVMLFEYLDKFYQSKIYYQKDGSGFFFINQDAVPFSKNQAENIYFLGIYSATLNKDISVKNFF